MVEQSRVFQNFPLAVMGGLMLASYVVPYEYRGLVGITSIVFVFSWILLEDVYLVRKTSPYNYLSVVARLPEGTVRFGAYIEGDPITSETEKGGYSSYFFMPWAVKSIPFFGPFKEFVINHQGTYKERFRFSKGKAGIFGTVVDHPNVANIEVWYNESYDLDRGEPIPVFDLAIGSADYYTHPLRNPVQIPDVDAMGSGNPGDLTEREAVLVALVGQLKSLLQEKTRQSSKWHEDAIRWQGMYARVKEENEGLRKNLGDTERMVWNMMFAIRRLQINIANAVAGKGWGRYGWLSKLKWLTPVLVLGMILVWSYYTGYLDNFSVWFQTGNNAILTLLFVLLVTMIVIFLRRRGGE